MADARMILFHVETLDLDKPLVRSRAWLPACLLRRAGLATRLVAGEVGADLLSAAQCLILTGGVSRHALSTARKAVGKLAIVLDIGSVGQLSELSTPAQCEAFRDLAGLASVITTTNEALARDIRNFLGAVQVIAVPDPIDIQDNLAAALRLHPGAVLRMLMDRSDRWLRDAVARFRGKSGHAMSQPTGKRIIWFGDSADPNGEGGLTELLLAASDLVDLAEQYPLQLDVVSQSPRVARRLLKQVSVPIVFHRYSPQRVRHILRKADLCILPAGGDRESLARSTARERLASALGVPVVARTVDETMLPAMRAALEATTATPARPDRSTLLAIREHEADSIRTAWQRVIDASHPSAGQRQPAGRLHSQLGRKLQVLLLLQQFQDIDLIVPVAEAASADPGMEVRVVVLSKIAVPASRRLRAICANGAKIEFWYGGDLLRRRIAPARFAADVGVTASEGPGFGARYARAFVAASQAAGTRILSLQHGIDNGGLTYGPPPSSSAFRGDLVMTWGGLHRLNDAARAEVREKAVPVGCPKRAFGRNDFPDFPLADRSFVAVFENLHWQRYSNDYRERFVSDLAAIAESRPQQTFLVKPHMGGRWFMRGEAAARPLPANVVIADPGAAQWRRFTADAFLAYASAVITTPSTIAFDAARYGVPVALVTYGIAAQNYAPLPRLEGTADWLSFIDDITRGRYDHSKLEAFFADAALPGDALTRILTVIRMAGAKRTYAEIMAALDGNRRDLAAS